MKRPFSRTKDFPTTDDKGLGFSLRYANQRVWKWRGNRAEWLHFSGNLTPCKGTGKYKIACLGKFIAHKNDFLVTTTFCDKCGIGKVVNQKFSSFVFYEDNERIKQKLSSLNTLFLFFIDPASYVQ